MLLAALLPAARPQTTTTLRGDTRTSRDLPIVDVFRDSSRPSVTWATLVDHQAAIMSIEPFDRPAMRYRLEPSETGTLFVHEPESAFDRGRFEVSKAAWRADPKVVAATKFLEQNEDSMFRFQRVSQARHLVGLSVLYLAIASALIVGYRCLRRGRWPIGALLLVAGVAVAPFVFFRSDGDARFVPLFVAAGNVPSKVEFIAVSRADVMRAAADETWTSAWIERARPAAENLVEQMQVERSAIDLGDARSLAMADARAMLRARARWSLLLACLGALAAMALRRRRSSDVPEESGPLNADGN
jgi:hypothetical protein